MKKTNIVLVVIVGLLAYQLLLMGQFKWPTLSEDDLIPKILETSPGQVFPLNNDRDYRIFGQIHGDGSYSVFEFTKNTLVQRWSIEDIILNVDTNQMVESTISTMYKDIPYRVSIQMASLVLDQEEATLNTSWLNTTALLSIALVVLVFVGNRKKN